jgi:hypothetical protein
MENMLEVVRIDRISDNRFPVREKIQSLGDAALFADEQTKRHAPHGDIFVVVQSGEVIYYPEE